MRIVACVPVFIVATLVVASFSDAGSRLVSVPVASVVSRIDGIAAVGSSGVVSRNVARVKDRRYASMCGPTYRVQLECCDVIETKGFGDCNPPVAATKEVKDCGTTKVTNIEFKNGQRIQFRKDKRGRVIEDFDRHN